MKSQRAWTDEEVDYLKTHYHTMPVSQMMATLNRSRPSIQGMVQVLGLKSSKTIAYLAINHTYFSDVSSNEQAYILGLLAADGSIDPTGKLRLFLHKKDKHLVEWVRDRVCPLHSVRDHHQHEAVGFAVKSQQVTHDLAEFHIVQNKSYTLQWPKKLKPEIERSFLLGYFDGDGSISFKKRGDWKPQLCWNLYGTYSFLTSVTHIIEKHTGICPREPRKPRPHRSVWTISLSPNKAIEVDRWLNQDGMGLQRKHLR